MLSKNVFKQSRKTVITHKVDGFSVDCNGFLQYWPNVAYVSLVISYYSAVSLLLL